MYYCINTKIIQVGVSTDSSPHSRRPTEGAVPSLRSVTFALPRCARSLPSLRSVTSLRSDVAALAALGRLRPPSLNSVVALASLGQLCPSSLRSVVALASLVHLAPLGHLPRCARLLPSVTSLRSDDAALAALGRWSSQ